MIYGGDGEIEKRERQREVWKSERRRKKRRGKSVRGMKEIILEED